MSEKRVRPLELVPRPRAERRPIVVHLDERSRRRSVAQVLAEIDWNGDRARGRVTMEQLLGAL
jgi:hypothetical protein